MGDEPEFHTGRTEHQAREHRLRRACVCATREGRSAHSMLLTSQGAASVCEVFSAYTKGRPLSPPLDTRRALESEPIEWRRGGG